MTKHILFYRSKHFSHCPFIIIKYEQPIQEKVISLHAQKLNDFFVERDESPSSIVLAATLMKSVT